MNLARLETFGYFTFHLCQGGNFVIKMFTAFEHQMVSLMYLLACVFQEIQVIKPGRNMYITHCTACVQNVHCI